MVAGIITRVSPPGHLAMVGHFFDEVYREPPKLAKLCELRASQAAAVFLFGPLGFKDGTWPIVGYCENWRPENWPTPTFVRTELLSGRRYEVWLDKENPSRVLAEKLLPPGDVRGLPAYSASGHIAVQVKMAQRLGLR
jgi:hypothetical protein